MLPWVAIILQPVEQLPKIVKAEMVEICLEKVLGNKHDELYVHILRQKEEELEKQPEEVGKVTIILASGSHNVILKLLLMLQMLGTDE